MSPKVSVIIPVYKVEAFIERCAVSLMEQTLGEAEFIFVDDASPDRSIEILRGVLERYPQREARILTHEVNRGLPSARNTGLAEALGEYVYHCDSDDWVEKDMLEKMYRKAEELSADFVYSDFYLSFEKNERYMATPDYGTPDEALRMGFLGGAMKFNVWNKLVRRSLYTDNGIMFPDGHPMGEDMTMIQLLAVSKSVAAVHSPLYHYVKLNANAYSNNVSQRNLDDTRFNVARTEAFLEERFPGSYTKEIALFKLNIKLPFLLSDDRAQYRLWKEWYPESNAYVMSNGALPLRTRLLQWMASKNLWLGVRLYYVLVHKFVYGIIYR